MKNAETQKQLAQHPSFEEVLENLPDDQTRHFIQELVDFCATLRMKPKWYATNSFNVKFKGKVIFRFSMHGRLDIYFTVEPSRSKLEPALESMKQETRDLYFSHMRKCTQCSPKHHGASITLFGVNYDKLCGIGEMFMRNPEPELLPLIYEFILWRREYIKNISI